MKFIEKNIYKILIALSLCLTLIITLTFTNKTYAQEIEDTNPYEILPNGIKSKNIWNENYIIGNINPNNGNVESGIRVVSEDYIEIESNTQYGTNQSDIGIAFYTSNYTFISFNWYVNYFTTPTNAKYIKFHMPGGYGTTYKYDIMIVKGNYIPSYMRYGTINGNNEYNWNNDLVQENENLIKNSTTALYNALNGAYAELIGRNQEILASGNCELEENTRRFEIGNLPESFSNYYHNYDSENEDYYTNPDIKIYLNYTVTNSLLFSFTDTQVDKTITLQNSNNTNSVTATNGGNNDMIDPYTLIINKENIGYDIIYYSGVYIPDYWNINFNISFDAYTYSQGYTKGVESQQTKISIAEGNKAYYKRLYEQTNANYEELLERYNQINDNNSLYGMIVAIADTPINIFKQIFNFDILGINISGVVFGLISLLVIIWLIKKLI